MSDRVRVPLYDRIPEIHRIKDQEQIPGNQLKAFLSLVEGAFGEIHADIESLYHNLFIDTCDDWVIPYIGDLLGTSHLKGDSRTLRRDVAQTVSWRRRKGTLGAIESLTEALTEWGVHATELMKDLVWAQNLNHQRPDAGGLPPYGLPTVDRHTVVRGGTATMRDPATLALVDTPFDPFARMPDFRKAGLGDVRPNLPNLGIFLWRLCPYRIGPVSPVYRGRTVTGLGSGLAGWVLRFDLHPLGDPVRLFNLDRSHDDLVSASAAVDGKPGPIHAARLNSMRPPLYRGPNPPASPGVGDLWFDTSVEAGEDLLKQWDGGNWIVLEDLIVEELVGGGYGKPDAYLLVRSYDPDGDPLERSATHALEFHLPDPPFSPFEPADWKIRGADLMAWEDGLRRPLEDKEIAVDPAIGRAVIGVGSAAQATAVRRHLRVVLTYGAVGPVGAHPIDRVTETPATHVVDDTSGLSLADALGDLSEASGPVVVEIRDDAVHDLDPAAAAGAVEESGEPTLVLSQSLTIRAADGKRPIVRLARPLRLRGLDADHADRVEVRLEGLYVTRGPGWKPNDPLVSRVDLASLSLDGCTLDPSGGTGPCEFSARSPVRTAIKLLERDKKLRPAGPEIHLRRCVSGPLRIDPGYWLYLTESIIDAGSGVDEDPAGAGYAVAGAGEPAGAGWGPETGVESVTFFGRARVERLSGRGGIWTQPCEVLDDQRGCIKFSYVAGRGDRLPQSYGCVRGAGSDPAWLRFVSEIFGRPEYGQIDVASDFRVRERGAPQPDAEEAQDAMGAYGFLLEALKWRNLETRYREFMPVGVRPLLIPVT